MASLVQHVAGLACPPLSGASRRQAPMRPSALVCGTYVLSKDEKEQERMRTLFDEPPSAAALRPWRHHLLARDLESAVRTTDIDTDIGSSTVFMTTSNGAFIDIQSKATAFLPIDEACLLDIDHIEEAGIRRPNDETLILSLQSIQQDLAWERCRQLQAGCFCNVALQVIGGNKGGVVGLSSMSQGNGRQPSPTWYWFSCLGTVESLKPYGAFIDIGGINGLLHVSQISHDRVANVSTAMARADMLRFQPE
ncbi:hypothetical protein ZWY2020_011226, partial [Hordeum vulgare]